MYYNNQSQRSQIQVLHRNTPQTQSEFVQEPDPNHQPVDNKDDENGQLQTQLKEKEYLFKKVYWQCTTLNSRSDRAISPYVSLLLKGDVVVSLSQNGQEGNFSRLSLLNEFKKVELLRFDREISVFEMTFEQRCEGIEQYDGVIKLLNSTSHASFHEFAEGLVYHKIRMSMLKAAQNSFSSAGSMENLKNISEKSFIAFKEHINQTVKQMVVSGELQIFKFNLFKMDYEKGDFYMTHCSSSEVLLSLMGISVEQAEQFCMRKGVWEFLYHHDVFGIQKYFLKIAKGEIVNDSVSRVIIKTFDGIELYINLRWKIIYNQDPILNNLFGPFLQHFAIIQSYEIKPSELNLFQIERRQLSETYQFSNFNNEQDWEYNLQSELLLKKFYPVHNNQQQKRQSSPQTSAQTILDQSLRGETPCGSSTGQINHDSEMLMMNLKNEIIPLDASLSKDTKEQYQQA